MMFSIEQRIINSSRPHRPARFYDIIYPMSDEQLGQGHAEELSPQELLDQYGISPEMARFQLESRGLSEDAWAQVKTVRGQSHELRALITIAEGVTQRLVEDIYEAHTLADIEHYNRTSPTQPAVAFTEEQWNKSRHRLRDDSLSLRKRFADFQAEKSEPH